MTKEISRERLIDIVSNLLANDVECRNNDNILYINVIGNLDAEVLGMSVVSFYKHLRKMNIPSYDTVTRIRRKVQEEHPEFGATGEVKALRENKRKEFKEYFSKN